MPNTDTNINEQGIPSISFTVSPSQNVQTAVDKTLTISEMAADAKATGDAIADVASDLSLAIDDIDAIKDWTGSNIPVSEGSTTTIAEALQDTMSMTWPVGSIYISASPVIPDIIAAIGTWQEVKIPLSWNDMKHGTRNYQEAELGFVAGNLHFWLRVE